MPLDPMPPDYAAFYWSGGNLDLHLLTQGEHGMQMTLFNAAGEELGVLMASDPMGLDMLTAGDSEMKHLHVPDLEAGTYVLAFEGDFGAVYSVSIGPPYYVYMPVVIRE